jgi:hypothetical protein
MDSANSAEKRFARGCANKNYRNGTFAGLLLNTATGMLVNVEHWTIKPGSVVRPALPDELARR